MLLCLSSKWFSWTCSISFPLKFSRALSHWCIIFVCYTTSLSWLFSSLTQAAFWDPMDRSPPGSSVHGILQARILEWVAISFSRGSSLTREQTRVSCIADYRSVVSISWNLMDYTVHGFLQTRILEWVGVPFSRGSSQPRDQTQSPALQADSLPAEPPPGKPKNTGVGSLSLLQGIFLTQESNQSLLHWRWILPQLRYQGSPSQ